MDVPFIEVAGLFILIDVVFSARDAADLHSGIGGKTFKLGRKADGHLDFIEIRGIGQTVGGNPVLFDAVAPVREVHTQCQWNVIVFTAMQDKAQADPIEEIRIAVKVAFCFKRPEFHRPVFVMKIHRSVARSQHQVHQGFVFVRRPDFRPQGCQLVFRGPDLLIVTFFRRRIIRIDPGKTGHLGRQSVGLVFHAKADHRGQASLGPERPGVPKHGVPQVPHGSSGPREGQSHGDKDKNKNEDQHGG